MARAITRLNSNNHTSTSIRELITKAFTREEARLVGHNDMNLDKFSSIFPSLKTNKRLEKREALLGYLKKQDGSGSVLTCLI